MADKIARSLHERGHAGGAWSQLSFVKVLA
jgi:hypothetical protein